MDEEPAEESIRRLKQIGCSQRLPGTNAEAAKAEELLAEEMSKLSMSEQDVASFEIHGIATEVEETPELVARSLVELESELVKIKKNKSSYEKAMAMNPAYVTDQSFRLQFLRCENFNCKNAAGRLVLHFRQKEELFGSGDVLVRDVRLSDMTPGELDEIKSGTLQLLPTADVAGRAVLCTLLGMHEDFTTARGAQRTFYYIMQAAMQDEMAQKKGLVMIIQFVGKEIEDGIGFSVLKNVYQTRLAVPHRLDAMHICYNNKIFRPFAAGFRFFLDKRGRTRSRTHFGNQQHILFQLQTYGIPISDDSPLRPVNGEYQLAWHLEWLQMRQAQETEVAGTQETPKILIPHRFDVLFGRSAKARCHTGNLRALHLVHLWQDKYDGAPNRAKKAEISDRVVGIIHESCGRFLKWEDNGWVEVGDEVARDKIAHFFRNQRRQKQDGEETKPTASKRSHGTLAVEAGAS